MFSISQTGIPEIENLLNSPATCDLLNGSLDISVSGGVTPYEYSIDEGMTYQISNTFSNLDSGTYTVYIRDANSCFIDDDVQIDRVGGPDIDSITSFIDTCGLGVGSIEIHAAGIGNLEYSLSGTEYKTERKFENLLSGDYNVFIKDSLSCVTSIFTNIKSIESPTIANISTTRTECNMSNGSFAIEVTNSQQELTYFLNNEIISYPDDVPSLASGEYIVTVIDSFGCQDQAVFTIDKEGCTVFVPNAFSPNSDQNNDIFDITLQNGFEGEVISLNIYDRWGQQVYTLKDNTSNDYSWDGRFNGNIVSSGVYVYTVEVVHFNGKRELFKGDLTVLD